MFTFINKYKIYCLLWFFILAYIIYFSSFTILRYKTLYSSYYDLGIMNQTVFNTYRAIKEKNPAKILKATDPMTGLQIKRMAIHNDLLLAPIALLYFIHPGPETLLVLQSVVLGLGALAVFNIVLQIFKNTRHKEFLALIFACSYLLYTPMQRANIFDFHAVTLATSFLLWMIYFWLEKKYTLSLVFLVLSLLSKEQVGLTTMVFGVYTLFSRLKENPKGRQTSPKHEIRNPKTTFVKTSVVKQIQKLFTPRSPKDEAGFRDSIFEFRYSALVIIISIIWVLVSFLVIIPYFRGGNHFAVNYYGDFGDSPIRIIIGIMKNPYSVEKYLMRIDTLRYFLFLLGPLGFLSFLSPTRLFIALPEIAINLLSNNWNMRNIIFHYTAVIQPFVFLSTIYGAYNLTKFKVQSSKFKVAVKDLKLIGILILVSTLVFAYFKGPLPFAREQEIHPFKYPQQSTKEIAFWAKTLKDPKLRISATGQAAPLFSSREYLYLFSSRYYLADYVVVTLNEIYNYPEKDTLIPIYEELRKDKRFEKIYGSKIVEVYRKRKCQISNGKSTCQI